MEAKDLHTGATVYIARSREIVPLEHYVPRVIPATVGGVHTDELKVYLTWLGVVEWEAEKVGWHDIDSLYATYGEAFGVAKHVAIRAHKQALNAAGKRLERESLEAEDRAVELRAEAQKLYQQANQVEEGWVDEQRSMEV